MSGQGALVSIIGAMVAVPGLVLLAGWAWRKALDWLAVRLEDRARLIRRNRLATDLSVGKALRVWTP